MSGSGVGRRRVMGAGAAAAMVPLLRPGRGWAQTPAEAPADPVAPLSLDDLVRLDLGEDDAKRMRVSVRVNGRGPFPFTVDTGADHSVISTELAAALDLPQDGVANVNGIAGVRLSACTRVARMEAGAVRLDGARLPLLPRGHLGGLGLIGLDCLADQRMEIDFDRRVMELRRSRGFARDPDEIVVRGKSRFGKLILVDSSVRGRPVYVVLDSGAQNSMGNAALRDLLADRRRRARLPGSPLNSVLLESATGQTVNGESEQAPDLVLGGVHLQRVPVIYADLHTFRLYRLETEPALMLGMDTLRVFRRVWVDFARREVGFLLPRDAFAGPAINTRI